MDKEALEAKKTETEATMTALANRVQQLDAMRKAAYEDYLRVQGRLNALNEILALSESETPETSETPDSPEGKSIPAA